MLQNPTHRDEFAPSPKPFRYGEALYRRGIVSSEYRAGIGRREEAAIKVGVHNVPNNFESSNPNVVVGRRKHLVKQS